jgi:hypothetical protein
VLVEKRWRDKGAGVCRDRRALQVQQEADLILAPMPVAGGFLKALGIGRVRRRFGRGRGSRHPDLEPTAIDHHHGQVGRNDRLGSPKLLHERQVPEVRGDRLPLGHALAADPVGEPFDRLGTDRQAS